MKAGSSGMKVGILVVLGACLCVLSGCRSPAEWRKGADEEAAEIIRHKQIEALGREEPLDIEPPADTLRRRLLLEQNLPQGEPSLPKVQDPLHGPPSKAGEVHDGGGAAKGEIPAAESNVTLTLIEALQVGARNSREYQTRKEEVFRAALRLDLERDEFRNSFAGLVEGLLGTSGQSGSSVTEAAFTGEGSVARRLRSGAELTAMIALDLVKLLTQGRSSSLGIAADASVSIPLLGGAGKEVATEALTQAERDVLYAIWDFERFKRSYAVRVAGDYLAVLLSRREVDNVEENYRGLIASTRRARRLAEAGRLPWFQFDQSLQNELRARDRWIRGRESYARRLDAFKVVLGLPADARIELDADELVTLTENMILRLAALPEPPAGRNEGADAVVELEEPDRQGAGPFELREDIALELALDNRLDVGVALERIHDARRGLVVAADALRGGLDLVGSAAVGERRGPGSSDRPDGTLDFSKARYSALLALDLPLDRVAERNAFRESYIFLARAERDGQEIEDQVKLEVRDRLRNLLESREGMKIQYQAVEIAERRVKSTDLFLQAGRADIRDVLESSEALLGARNALASALVDYRVSELELQRDLGLLQVDEKGLWKEFNSGEMNDGRFRQ